MKTTIALVAIALVGLACVSAVSAEPTVVHQCGDLPNGLGTACVHADANVDGDCTQSCTVTANGSVTVV